MTALLIKYLTMDVYRISYIDILSLYHDWSLYGLDYGSLRRTSGISRLCKILILRPQTLHVYTCVCVCAEREMFFLRPPLWWCIWDPDWSIGVEIINMTWLGVDAYYWKLYGGIMSPLLIIKYIPCARLYSPILTSIYLDFYASNRIYFQYCFFIPFI